MALVVEAEIRSGEYASAKDVVSESLTILRDRDAEVEQWLRTEVVQAYDGFESDPFTAP